VSVGGGGRYQAQLQDSRATMDLTDPADRMLFRVLGSSARRPSVATSNSDHSPTLFPPAISGCGGDIASPQQESLPPGQQMAGEESESEEEERGVVLEMLPAKTQYGAFAMGYRVGSGGGATRSGGLATKSGQPTAHPKRKKRYFKGDGMVASVSSDEEGSPALRDTAVAKALPKQGRAFINPGSLAPLLAAKGGQSLPTSTVPISSMAATAPVPPIAPISSDSSDEDKESTLKRILNRRRWSQGVTSFTQGSIQPVPKMSTGRKSYHKFNVNQHTFLTSVPKPDKVKKVGHQRALQSLSGRSDCPPEVEAYPGRELQPSGGRFQYSVPDSIALGQAVGKHRSIAPLEPEAANLGSIKGNDTPVLKSLLSQQSDGKVVAPSKDSSKLHSFQHGLSSAPGMENKGKIDADRPHPTLLQSIGSTPARQVLPTVKESALALGQLRFSVPAQTPAREQSKAASKRKRTPDAEENRVKKVRSASSSSQAQAISGSKSLESVKNFRVMRSKAPYDHNLRVGNRAIAKWEALLPGRSKFSLVPFIGLVVELEGRRGVKVFWPAQQGYIAKRESYVYERGNEFALPRKGGEDNSPIEVSHYVLFEHAVEAC
jgi:hypothetical protein